MLFPRWPWKQKSLLSAKAVAWSWYSSNDLKNLFLWSSFSKTAHPHSTMSQLIKLTGPGKKLSLPLTSSLCSWIMGLSFVHTLNISKAVFPAEGGGKQQACLGGSAQQFSVIQITAFPSSISISGTGSAAEILTTYSSCPRVGTKISKGKHKIILLQDCTKRSK